MPTRPSTQRWGRFLWDVLSPFTQNVMNIRQSKIGEGRVEFMSSTREGAQRKYIMRWQREHDVVIDKFDESGHIMSSTRTKIAELNRNLIRLSNLKIEPEAKREIEREKNNIVRMLQQYGSPVEIVRVEARRAHHIRVGRNVYEVSDVAVVENLPFNPNDVMSCPVVRQVNDPAQMRSWREIAERANEISREQERVNQGFAEVYRPNEHDHSEHVTIESSGTTAATTNDPPLDFGNR